jgi:hypothetical protein
MIERDRGKARELMMQLQADTAEALEDLRDLARGIYPPPWPTRGWGRRSNRRRASRRSR